MSNNREQNQHDESYKLLFSQPEMVASLLQDLVPEEWVHDVDFSTLEKQNGSYVTDDLRERHDDIIWRVKFREQWFYVYLLIEFQSTMDPWMAARINSYVALLYLDLIKSQAVKNGEHLPPVFPLVLYNGYAPWTASQNIAELIVPTSLGLVRYRPSLRYFLVDERRLPEDRLQADGPAVYLVRMERNEEIQGLHSDISSFIKKYNEPRYLSLRRALNVWIKRVLRQRLGPEEIVPDVNELEEVEAMLADRIPTWTEKWKMEGLAEGEVKGEAKGRMEGEAAGRSAILSRILAKRFGQDILDIRLQERLHNATSEQLDRWTDRILDAKTVDEVFGE